LAASINFIHSYLDQNRYQALEGITNLVKDVVADLEANGEEIPEPISQRSYSGKSSRGKCEFKSLSR